MFLKFLIFFCFKLICYGIFDPFKYTDIKNKFLKNKKYFNIFLNKKKHFKNYKFILLIKKKTNPHHVLPWSIEATFK
jgi:hypothetical protein